MGLSHYRNNVSPAKNIPTEWDVKSGKTSNGRPSWARRRTPAPVVANGKVFIGTNNSAGYLKRYPSKVDPGASSYASTTDWKIPVAAFE